MNISKVKVLPFILSTLIVLSFSGCTSSKDTPTTTTKTTNTTTSTANRNITDMDGNVVEVPAKVEKIGTSWPGFINALLTVGGSDKIVSSSDAIKNYPWALKIFPKLNNISYPFSTAGLSAEELLKEKPDVLFLRKGDAIDKVKEIGIPVIMIDYKKNSIYDMIDAVTLVGKVLGDKEAQKAAKYKDFVTQNINKITTVTKKITADKKLKVVALAVKGKDLSTWGKNIIQNEEISMVGGINVAANDIDGSKVVSFDQILKWNPDVIFLDGTEKDRATLLADSRFAQLNAVVNEKVFVVPQGIFKWSNLGSETALYLPWMAKTLYPDKFKDLDIKSEAKSFYKTFFGYSLTDQELTKILNAQNP